MKGSATSAAHPPGSRLLTKMKNVWEPAVTMRLWNLAVNVDAFGLHFSDTKESRQSVEIAIAKSFNRVNSVPTAD